MPYHSVDQFTKTNKYKAIGNKSKNDFLPKTKSSQNFNKIKKNKNKFYNNYDFDFVLVTKGIFPQNTVTKVFPKQNNIINNNESLTRNEKFDICIPSVKADFITIVETETFYNVPQIIII